MPAIDRTLGFYQIAKYNYFPGWHQQSTTNEIVVNMDAWNKLEPAHQAMFQAACDANFMYELSDGESLQAAAMIANEKDGVTMVTWSDEVLDELRAKWGEVLAEELAASEDVTKLWNHYTAFHEEYQVWGSRGYLKN